MFQICSTPCFIPFFQSKSFHPVTRFFFMLRKHSFVSETILQLEIVGSHGAERRHGSILECNALQFGMQVWLFVRDLLPRASGRRSRQVPPKRRRLSDYPVSRIISQQPVYTWVVCIAPYRRSVLYTAIILLRECSKNLGATSVLGAKRVTWSKFHAEDPQILARRYKI